ncbi:hypothetical protein E4U17_004302 [Claviceps sp. LM77 group G4]|nr:hypothetical protein E4U17_004302 [Claviceps sp. LM77 group G4]KAG6076990.1 hypothetical protein E4U16_002486 [Claviceps sp. LM84 group G4]KAG6082619.1 hypothetical protein E4U33_005490 [Claviceps sp. LM78 group G4]
MANAASNGIPPAQTSNLGIEDTPEPQPRGAARSGRRSGGGRGEGREVQISKALSRLLRHQAQKAGIDLDGEGFARLDQVLQWGPLNSLNVSLTEIKSIVETNAKQRFALKPKSPVSEGSSSPRDYLIRANQGHSLAVDPAAMFTPINMGDADFPARVIHGTYFVFWDAILTSGGLKPMNRGHIHCSDKTLEEGALSGMRKDAELLIEIDLERSLGEGITWWRSQNGVILTDGGEGGVLDARFFKSVRGRVGGVGVLWEEGVKKADLPAGLKMAVPMGKANGGRRGGKRGGGGGRGGHLPSAT